MTESATNSPITSEHRRASITPINITRKILADVPEGLDNVDTKLASHARRLNGIDNRFSNLSHKLEVLGQKLHLLDSGARKASHRIDRINTDFKD